MKLELDSRLRVFAAIARQHSFTKAAEELSISQPAVSRHILDLENDLGIQLIHRKTQDVRLTAAGEYLAQYVLRAEALLTKAERGLKEYAQSPQAVLNIAASGTPGNYLLPLVLASYRQTQPNVSINLYIGTSSLAVDAVRSHRAELGVVGGLAAYEDLDVDPIWKDEIVLIGSPSLASQIRAPADLRRHTWLTREQGSSTRLLTEAAWQDLGIIPEAVIELPSWEAIKLAVANGAGIAACSLLAVQIELRAGILSMLDVPAWQARRNISLIKLSGVELSSEAAGFRETLISHLIELNKE